MNEIEVTGKSQRIPRAAVLGSSRMASSGLSWDQAAVEKTLWRRQGCGRPQPL